MQISIGASRKSISWQQTDLTWPQFIALAKKRTKTGTETHEEYMHLPKSQQDALKDNGGFVAGALEGGRRKRGCCTSRSMVTLDIDNAPPGSTDDLCAAVGTLGCQYLIYGTRKHDPEHPRLRVVIPTDRAMSPDEYQPIARATAQMIDPDMRIFDTTTFEAERLMYWPSASKDSVQVFQTAPEGAKFAPVDALLATYEDWHNAAEWPLCPAENAPTDRGSRQADPTQKPGLVGAFCRVYDIPGAIEKFLPGTYTSAGNNRYTYTGGSTTAGAVLYDNGTFLYSHHSTDPAGGQLVNAWDLVRIHLYGAEDAAAQPDTPHNRLPSFTAMSQLARTDPAVFDQMSTERAQEVLDGFEPIPPSESSNAASDGQTGGPDWHSLLETDAKGHLRSTAQNMRLLMQHDPALAGKIWNDLFAMRRKCTVPLPWNPGENPGERWWSDTDDAGIRWYVETIYHLQGAGKLADAVRLEAEANAKDPVVEYLNSLTWDGIPRVATAFHDYLGALDTRYNRAVARKSLAAAVARAYKPGQKYDQVVIFSGRQGIGKSTFVAKMGMKWFTDSLTNFGNKEARENIRGVWLVELGELTALDKSENEAAKQFISQCEDVYRPSYGQNTVNYPRRCVFFGTSNKTEFLRDSTGNRRFWPVDTNRCTPKYDINAMGVDAWLPQQEVDQLWAEAVEIYRAGEKLYFTNGEIEAALQAQETHRETDTWLPLIQTFLDRPVPKDWRTAWTADMREHWWANTYVDRQNVEIAARDYVCTMEIWVECLNERPERITIRDQRRINSCLDEIPGWDKTNNIQRFLPYGRCKAWRNKNP